MNINNSISAYDRVKIARAPGRPKIDDFINNIFDDFIELKGDRIGGDDESILGGIGMLNGIPVTIIGHKKGKNLDENVRCNFGMTNPQGYRKALRLMEQANKFNRPIITFVDTPGAYPGMEAEENGQSIAIANCLAKMSQLSVPIITVITGEGNSGGALAIAVANTIIMLENSVYSILSPEGFASILWKDSSKSDKACECMRMTSYDLFEDGMIDEIIPESEGGMIFGDNYNCENEFIDIKESLVRNLNRLMSMSANDIVKDRFTKIRNIGATVTKKSLR